MLEKGKVWSKLERKIKEMPLIIPPRNEIVGGYTGFTMSVRL
jgi:hypothetical protein